MLWIFILLATIHAIATLFLAALVLLLTRKQRQIFAHLLNIIQAVIVVDARLSAFEAAFPTVSLVKRPDPVPVEKKPLDPNMN